MAGEGRQATLAQGTPGADFPGQPTLLLSLLPKHPKTHISTQQVLMMKTDTAITCLETSTSFEGLFNEFGDFSSFNNEYLLTMRQEDEDRDLGTVSLQVESEDFRVPEPNEDSELLIHALPVHQNILKIFVQNRVNPPTTKVHSSLLYCANTFQNKCFTGMLLVPPSQTT